MVYIVLVHSRHSTCFLHTASVLFGDIADESMRADLIELLSFPEFYSQLCTQQPIWFETRNM